MPHSFFAALFFSSMLIRREIIILCACGEPAPCMDSVRYPTAADPLTGHLRSKVLLRGHGHQQTAGNILSKSRDFIRKTGHIVLVDISQQGVDCVCTAWLPVPFGCTGNAAAVKGFIKVVHFHYLVFNVRSTGHSVVLCNALSCPY